MDPAGHRIAPYLRVLSNERAKLLFCHRRSKRFVLIWCRCWQDTVCWCLSKSYKLCHKQFSDPPLLWLMFGGFKDKYKIEQKFKKKKKKCFSVKTNKKPSTWLKVTNNLLQSVLDVIKLPAGGKKCGSLNWFGSGYWMVLALAGCDWMQRSF